MKHCIIVKFKPDISVKTEDSFIGQIKNLFEECLEIEGIHSVEVFKNCVARGGRADIMIEIDMDKKALESYDKSDAHLMWKMEYSRFIESKMIFDYESNKSE